MLKDFFKNQACSISGYLDIEQVYPGSAPWTDRGVRIPFILLPSPITTGCIILETPLYPGHGSDNVYIVEYVTGLGVIVASGSLLSINL